LHSLFFCSHYLTESIAESFQARSDAVQAEVEQSLCLREEGLRAVVEEHRHHLGLHTALHHMSVFACEEVKALGSLRENTVRSVFSHHVHQKLKSLGGMTSRFQDNVQQTVVTGFKAAVLEEFSRGKKVLQPKLLEQALNTLTQKTK